MQKVVLLLVVLISLSLGAPSALAEGPTVLFGTSHAVGLRNNGEVLTWGENIYCQLGRPSGNAATTPGLVMRNVKEIAVANTHTLALTTDGKVYAWGGNPGGALGLGHEYEQCEGPALVESLADKTITHISAGLNFAVAVSSRGDLFCAGGNDMLQCPVAKGGRPNVFLPVSIPELAGNVASISSGGFHTLIQTRDGKMYAFGRGRDGQLGNGRTVNGFAAIPELTGAVSFSAGIWHSAAVGADGSVWLWGNDIKSQLCDGATTNRSTPAKVTMPPGVKVTRAFTGGHSTVLQAGDGALYACGDNQVGLFGSRKRQMSAADEDSCSLVRCNVVFHGRKPRGSQPGRMRSPVVGSQRAGRRSRRGRRPLCADIPAARRLDALRPEVRDAAAYAGPGLSQGWTVGLLDSTR